MELKDRLAGLRSERGYSLRELRSRIEDASGQNIAVSYLSSLERVGGSPSLETLSAIATGYQMSLQELLQPVSFGADTDSDNLPEGLAQLQSEAGLDAQWIERLRRIPFRSSSTASIHDWRMIYSLLQQLDSKDASEDGGRSSIRAEGKKTNS